MLINPDVGIPGVGDFASLLRDEFNSALPSAASLERAWADPRFKALLSKDELGKALAETSVRALRFVAARASVEIGVPSGVLGMFEQMLTIRSGDQAVEVAVGITFDVADVLIDVAVEAMGAVPFVGWVGKLVKAVLDLIESRIRNKRPRPALISWSSEADNDLANRMLGSMRGHDWTSLFLPVYNPQRWDDWETIKQNGGWLFRCKASVVREGAYGALPGGPLGSAGVQSRNCVDLGVPAKIPGKSIPGKESHVEKLEKAYIARFPRAMECITDLYETTPSLSRIALASWQQMTTKAVPMMYQVDTRPIPGAWRNYVESAQEYSRVGTASPSDHLKYVALKNLAAAMRVRNWQIADEPPRSLLLSELAKLYCNDLRNRQLEGVKTSLAAYCSIDQAAFRDPVLWEALKDTRRRILQSPLRTQLNLDDVVDQDYRALLAQGGIPITASSPPDPLNGIKGAIGRAHV